MTRLKNRIPSSLPLLSLVGIIRVWSLLLQLCFERTLHSLFHLDSGECRLNSSQKKEIQGAVSMGCAKLRAA